MPPPTRRLFIQSYIANRPESTQGDIVTLWCAKSTQQKHEWVAFFNAAQSAKDELDTARDGPRRELARLANMIEYGPNPPLNTTSALGFRADVEALVRDLRALKPLFDNAIDAWSRLDNAEFNHPIPRGLRALFGHAEAEIRALEVVIDEMENDIHRLRVARGWPPVPSDAAGVRRMPEAWARDAPGYENERDAMRIAAVHGADMTNQTFRLPGPAGAGTWEHVPDREINGDPNMSCLWVRLNSQRRIQDRCFRKTAFMDEYQWRDPSNWEGDVRNPATKIPNELACHYTMQANAGNHIVNIRPQQYTPALVDHNTMSYRVYTDYCPYGDLENLIHLHKDNHGPDFREHFIWLAAESMVRGGLGMANNTVVNHPAGSFTRGEIVHKDMKPGNYFLGPERGGSRYPTVLLADFGQSVKTDAADPNNPAWFRDSGPVGYTAPEQRVWVDKATNQRLPGARLGERTNVFGVGLVLWSMVKLEWQIKEPAYLGGRNQDAYYHLPLNYKDYSEELLNMIRQCLRFAPNTRPSFQAMLNHILLHAPSHPDVDSDSSSDGDADPGSDDGSGSDSDGSPSSDSDFDVDGRTGLRLDTVDNYGIGIRF